MEVSDFILSLLACFVTELLQCKGFVKKYVRFLLQLPHVHYKDVHAKSTVICHAAITCNKHKMAF